MRPSRFLSFRQSALAFTLFAAVLALVPATASAAAGFSISKQQRVLGSSDDQLTLQKQETFIGLSSGQTKTVTLSCPSGYVVLDGSPLVQQVDQDAGSPADIAVIQSESNSPSSYQFTLENPTTGNAQAKAFVTCVKQTTNVGGGVGLSDPPIIDAFGFAQGVPATQTLTCPAGTIAVDPGFNFTSGEGRVIGSQPSSDPRSWVFTTLGNTDGTVNLSIRCLSTTTSDGDLIVAQDLFQTVSVPADSSGERVSSFKLTCPVGYKGATGSYLYDPNLYLLGHEPQPISRVFWFENTDTHAHNATIDLICLRTRLSHPLPFTTLNLRAFVGDVMQYKITVKNTGTTNLNFGALNDPGCDTGTIAGGPTTLTPGNTAVYTCTHMLTAANRAANPQHLFKNTATITAGAITHSSNTVTVKIN